MLYNDNNIFAQIIAEKVGASKIYEDDIVIVIEDINPVAPIHFLFIPKGRYVNFSDFISKAPEDEIAHYYKVIDKIANRYNAKDYRLITNNGENSGQSVFHFHTHLISGSKIHNLI